MVRIAYTDYTPRERNSEVIFMCNKAEVSEILNYHQEQGVFKESTYNLYKEVLDSQPDSFSYNRFMQRCQEKSYTPKLVRDDRECFYNSFRLRMYKFKKGKDWTKLH
jgi:glucan phosphorylase